MDEGAKAPYLPFGLSDREISPLDPVVYPNTTAAKSASPDKAPGYRLWGLGTCPPGLNRPNSADPHGRPSEMSSVPGLGSSSLAGGVDRDAYVPPAGSRLSSFMPDGPSLRPDAWHSPHSRPSSAGPHGGLSVSGRSDLSGVHPMPVSSDGFTGPSSLVGLPMDPPPSGAKACSPSEAPSRHYQNNPGYGGRNPLPFTTLATRDVWTSLPPGWTEGAEGGDLRTSTPSPQCASSAASVAGNSLTHTSGLAGSLGSVGSIGSLGGSWPGSYLEEEGGWPSHPHSMERTVSREEAERGRARNEGRRWPSSFGAPGRYETLGSGQSLRHSLPNRSAVPPMPARRPIEEPGRERAGSEPALYVRDVPSLLDSAGSGEHPTAERPGRGLFVRNLDSHVDDAYLRSLFETYGEVKSMHTQSRNRGFVIIHYYDIRHAEAALQNLQGSEILSRKMHIYYATKKPNPSEGDQNNGTLVVFNLPPTMTTAQVMEIFGQFGDIMEVRETPHRRHHKFVEYFDSRAAQHAKDMLNKQEIMGQKIKVDWSRPNGKPYVPEGPETAKSMPERYLLPRMDAHWHGSHLPSPQVPGSAPAFIGLGTPTGGFPAPYSPHFARGNYIGDYPTGLVLPTRPYYSAGSVPTSGSGGSGKRTNSIKPKTRGKNKPCFDLDIEKVKRGEESRTTLMIRNIPNKYSQKMMLEALDKGHAGRYDFFYLPIDFKNSCNVGYAFINFIKREYIPAFYYEFNRQKWDLFNSEKVCEITWGRIQGKDKLVAHFQNSSLMSEDETCRPCIFYSSGPKAGQREPFPLAGKAIRHSKRVDNRGRSRSYQE